jgi:O-antigen ligase
MPTVPATAPRPLQSAAAGAGLAVAGICLGIAGIGAVAAFDSTSTPLALSLAGGICLVAMTLLAVARYDAAVGVGLLLMAVVRVEPAPADAAFAVIMAVAAMTGRFRLGGVPRIATGLVAALLVVNVVSMVDAVEMREALKFSFVTGYLALFALWLTAFTDRERRSRLIVVTWLGMGVLSAVVSSLALNVGFPGAALLLTEDGSRARGLFKDPNVYGPFLVPIAVILLEQRFSRRLLHLRSWTSMGLFLLLALGVLFSYSRAAWANLLLAIVVMLLAAGMRHSGGRRAMRLLVGLLVAGGIAATVVGVTGSLGFLEQRAQLQSYDTERFGAQHAGYEMGWANPVGVGPGQFQYHHPVETHSTFVRVLAEQGFAGLAVWLGIVLATLVLALRNVVRGRETYGIGSAALLGSWCGLVFNSVVVDTLHWRHLWVVAALIWAGAMIDLRDRRAERLAAQM